MICKYMDFLTQAGAMFHVALPQLKYYGAFPHPLCLSAFENPLAFRDGSFLLPQNEHLHFKLEDNVFMIICFCGKLRERLITPHRHLQYLDRFFRRTCPLLVILGLFVLFATCRQVGVIGQTAEQRRDHWTGIHLLLWHTDRHTHKIKLSASSMRPSLSSVFCPLTAAVRTAFTSLFPIRTRIWHLSSPQKEPYSCHHTVGSSLHHWLHCCWWKDYSLWGFHRLKHTKNNLHSWSWGFFTHRAAHRHHGIRITI